MKKSVFLAFLFLLLALPVARGQDRSTFNGAHLLDRCNIALKPVDDNADEGYADGYCMGVVVSMITIMIQSHVACPSENATYRQNIAALVYYLNVQQRKDLTDDSVSDVEWTMRAFKTAYPCGK